MLQLGCVPVGVRAHDLAVPVLLDELLEILSVGGCGVWDVVVAEPALELVFVPFVVGL